MNDLIYTVFNYYSDDHVSPGTTVQVACLFFENHKNDDWSKSARIYSDTEKYHCFKCGITLDAVGLVKEMEELDWKDTLKFIEEKFYVKLGKHKKPKKSLLFTYEDLIVKFVVQKRLKQFNKIYMEMDKAIRNEDQDRLKYLLEGVKRARHFTV